MTELKDKLVENINGSGLPITAVAYVLQEILAQVNAVAAQQVAKQREEREKQAAQPAGSEKPE